VENESDYRRGLEIFREKLTDKFLKSDMKNRQNNSLTPLGDFSTMAAFFGPTIQNFLAIAPQRKVSRVKGGVGRTSSC